jgi:hypothetical protein
VFWRDGQPVYAGKTRHAGDTIRAAIRRHIRGEVEPSALQVTHFSFMPAADLDAKHFNLVLELGWLVRPNPFQANSTRA